MEEAYSDEEIALLASGQSLEPEQEEENSEELEGDESDAETEYEEGDAEPEEESGEEVEVEKPKTPKKVPYDRFKEVNEKAKQAEARAQQLEWEIQKRDEALQEVLKRMTDQTAQVEEEEEVLDTALEKKLKAEIDALKQAQSQSGLQAELATGRQQYTDLEDAANYLIAKQAQQTLINAQHLGYNMTEQQAIELATKTLQQEAQTMYQRNPSRGALSGYLYEQAKFLGYAPKKAGTKAGNGVNMKALNRLREEAGAPEVQRQAVNTSGSGNGDWRADLYKRNKEEGYSDSYLSKML